MSKDKFQQKKQAIITAIFERYSDYHNEGVPFTFPCTWNYDVLHQKSKELFNSREQFEEFREAALKFANGTPLNMPAFPMHEDSNFMFTMFKEISEFNKPIKEKDVFQKHQAMIDVIFECFPDTEASHAACWTDLRKWNYDLLTERDARHFKSRESFYKLKGQLTMHMNSHVFPKPTFPLNKNLFEIFSCITEGTDSKIDSLKELLFDEIVNMEPESGHIPISREKEKEIDAILGIETIVFRADAALFKEIDRRSNGLIRSAKIRLILKEWVARQDDIPTIEE